MASSLKLVVLLALVAAIATAAEQNKPQAPPAGAAAIPFDTAARSNDLILGKREEGDKIVVQESVNVARKLLQKVTAEKTFSAGRGVITQIRALNQRSKNAAEVTKTGGGVGMDYVKLRFKSQRSHGIHFDVEVYAKEDE